MRRWKEERCAKVERGRGYKRYYVVWGLRSQVFRTPTRPLREDFLGDTTCAWRRLILPKRGKEDQDTVGMRWGAKRNLCISKSENIFSVSRSAHLHTISCKKIQLLSINAKNQKRNKLRNEMKWNEMRKKKRVNVPTSVLSPASHQVVL